MGAFELQDTRNALDEPVECHSHHIPAPPKKVKDECIVAYKVYDSCRRQNCLTASELGPAMAAEHCTIGEHEHHPGEIIRPPVGATSVNMEKLRISKIHVVDKKPCPFRNGFWDIGIKYAFEYCLVFRDSSGCILAHASAKNFFNSKTTLFGSHGSDLIVGTDLFSRDSESITFEAAPFIWVEAKAVTFKCLQNIRKKITPFYQFIKIYAVTCFEVNFKGFSIPLHIPYD